MKIMGVSQGRFYPCRALRFNILGDHKIKVAIAKAPYMSNFAKPILNSFFSNHACKVWYIKIPMTLK